MKDSDSFRLGSNPRETTNIGDKNMKEIKFEVNGVISEEGKAKLLKHIEEGRKKMDKERDKYRKYFYLIKKMNDENRHHEFIYMENDKYYHVFWDSHKWSWPSEITFLE